MDPDVVLRAVEELLPLKPGTSGEVNTLRYYANKFQISGVRKTCKDPLIMMILRNRVKFWSQRTRCWNLLVVDDNLISSVPLKTGAVCHLLSSHAPFPLSEIGRAVQQECRDRSRMPSSA
eukprot:TRINITY_DN1199_c0_g1_i5.p1 TRINITY_DN1199_c0_g1~~TRINITY_DN1199_c0_g1_i5.p1  ORF type:complete len:120 (-),score=5.73 TRINITY_DN1199_c0_g1_i5:11-370(-)